AGRRLLVATRTGGGHEGERDSDDREPAGHRDQSSLSARMRSSRGGCVSNRRLSHESLPSAGSRASGDSIQRWAVALELNRTTVVSDFSFSRAEISPGG